MAARRWTHGHSAAVCVGQRHLLRVAGVVGHHRSAQQCRQPQQRQSTRCGRRAVALRLSSSQAQALRRRIALSALPRTPYRRDNSQLSTRTTRHGVDVSRGELTTASYHQRRQQSLSWARCDGGAVTLGATLPNGDQHTGDALLVQTHHCRVRHRNNSEITLKKPQRSTLQRKCHRRERETRPDPPSTFAETSQLVSNGDRSSCRSANDQANNG